MTFWGKCLNGQEQLTWETHLFIRLRTLCLNSYNKDILYNNFCGYDRNEQTSKERNHEYSKMLKSFTWLNKTKNVINEKISLLSYYKKLLQWKDTETKCPEKMPTRTNWITLPVVKMQSVSSVGSWRNSGKMLKTVYFLSFPGRVWQFDPKVRLAPSPWGGPALIGQTSRECYLNQPACQE